MELLESGDRGVLEVGFGLAGSEMGFKVLGKDRSWFAPCELVRTELAK